MTINLTCGNACYFGKINLNFFLSFTSNAHINNNTNRTSNWNGTVVQEDEQPVSVNKILFLPRLL